MTKLLSYGVVRGLIWHILGHLLGMDEEDLEDLGLG